ncbi:hypothetical protein NDU88_005628 [Pleurodeles waltl]|uniref:Uncharacterized protein n=1 Tax=Pleurodeles waltl TaxID=8319 RepID=A0AAV7MYI1_PLEWA|nr:hypothetical protein NDU88_005628 [Pleurodeles waltl]
MELTVQYLKPRWEGLGLAPNNSQKTLKGQGKAQPAAKDRETSVLSDAFERLCKAFLNRFLETLADQDKPQQRHTPDDGSCSQLSSDENTREDFDNPNGDSGDELGPS